jgi:hypothetical protein
MNVIAIKFDFKNDTMFEWFSNLLYNEIHTSCKSSDWRKVHNVTQNEEYVESIMYKYVYALQDALYHAADNSISIHFDNEILLGWFEAAVKDEIALINNGMCIIDVRNEHDYMICKYVSIMRNALNNKVMEMI